MQTGVGSGAVTTAQPEPRAATLGINIVLMASAQERAAQDHVAWRPQHP
jgi:hypothetical protein